MQVLVGGDALEHAVGDRVVARLTGVAVADAGRELLEGHVGDRVQQPDLVDVAVLVDQVLHTVGRNEDRVVPLVMWIMRAFEGDRVDAARDDEVVAHHDAVAVLLGGPPAHPVAPRESIEKLSAITR